MDKNAVERLEKAQKVLEDAGIGVIGLDDGFDEGFLALIVGGLEGVQEYVGARIEVENEALLLVLDIRLQGEGILDKEQATEYFKEIFEDFLAEEQGEIELEFVEEEEKEDVEEEEKEESFWGIELVRELEGDEELVESVQMALEHGLWFRINDDEDEAEELDDEE